MAVIPRPYHGVKAQINRLSNALAKPSVVFYALPWLMVILVLGTLAQKEIGLYQAQAQYFSAWLIWFGPLPLPGAYPTLGLITISLAAKFFLKSPWSIMRAGTWITHLGILVLLTGGLLTALTQREGFLVLDEGGQTSVISDYHARVLRILKNDQTVQEIAFEDMRNGMIIPLLPFRAEIIEPCENCLPAFVDPLEERKGMAAKVRLTSIAPEVQNEQNFAGFTLKVSESGGDANGIYVMMEEMSPRLDFKKDEDSYSLILGRAQRSLPFTLELVDFEKDMHPATNTARSYHSDVIVHDGEIDYPVRIEMNEPLRYKGYTIYQSSFSQAPDGTQRSVLSAVENKGRLFPYLASAILFAGLLLHLVLRLKKNTAAVLLTCALIGFGAPAQAQDGFLDMDAFQTLPVLHQGRTKPLDSFARASLITLKGSDSYDGKSAIEWLAETVFNPAQATQDPVFRVFKGTRFGLPAKDNPYYSYAEIAPVMADKISLIEKIIAQDENTLSADQKELIALHDATILYAQLLRSFAAYLPLALSIPESLKREWKIRDGDLKTLQDFKRYEVRIKNKVKEIIKAKGSNPEKYTDDEKEIAAFAYSISVMDQAGMQNLLLRILPGPAGAAQEWYSPWALGQAGMGSPENAAYLRLWQDMIAAYRDGNAQVWNTTTHNALQFIESSSAVHHDAVRYDPAGVRLELIYNRLHPIGLAMIFYAAAFLFFAARAIFAHPTFLVWAARLSFAALISGLLANSAAIALRVFILDRPPVGTLYESILFVAAVCALGAVILEIKRRDGLGLLTGSLAGGILLFIAGSFAGADTMQVLVAVLNTNFWLTVHVLCITMGYGWCVIAALLAHYYLFARWCAQAPHTRLVGMESTIKLFTLIALLFTAVGTILGGIWADQSWGRFWGWDPKENGALLIVLWIVWALHGLLGRNLNQVSFIAAIAFLNIIVALAWFGVNLLSTGLHSYGFIEGVATGLAVFCALEVTYVCGLWFMIRKQEGQAGHA